MTSINLKGGVIIIGSLLWDDSNGRKLWRKQNLKPISEARSVLLPIRYGRESSSRSDTYTMIFSTAVSSDTGTGKIIPFISPVSSFEDLEIQATALALAEGIYGEHNKRLSSNWGSIGILINPKLEENEKAVHSYISGKWADIYLGYAKTLNPKSYKAHEAEVETITNLGFLNIKWTDQMNEFDLLLATPVVPKPTRILAPVEIADRMIQRNYFEYFEKNHENGISTGDDQEIMDRLKQKRK